MRIIRCAGATLLALMFCGATAFAAPLTLRDCLLQAIANSPQLGSVRHDILAASSDITKERGTTLPYLSSRLQTWMIQGAPVYPFAVTGAFVPDLTGAGSARTSRFADAHWDPVAIEQVGVTYPLYQYGSIMGLNDAPVVNQSRSRYTQQQWEILLEEQKVVLDVVNAYAYAIWYRDQSEMEQQTVQYAQRELDIMQSEQSLGIKLPQDVALAREEVQSARDALSISQQNSRNAALQLASLIGQPGNDNLEVARVELPTPPLPPLNQFMQSVIPIHPALRVQDANVQIAQQQIKISRADILPTASLNTELLAGQDLEYPNGGTHHRRPYAFESYLEVDIPIWDFGQRRAALNESREEVFAQKDKEQAIELALRTAIAQAYSEIGQVNENLSSLEAAQLQASNTAELARAQRSLGAADELTLVQAEVALLSARITTGSEVLLKQIKYAELQNLSGGSWHWLQ